MKFGKYLLAMRIQGWEEFYVDYKALQRYVCSLSLSLSLSLSMSIIRHYKGMYALSLARSLALSLSRSLSLALSLALSLYVDYKALQRYVVCERYIGGRSSSRKRYVCDILVGGVALEKGM